MLAEHFGERPAVIDSIGQTLSFSQLSTSAHTLATALVALGIPSGQAVASLLPNSIEAVWTSYGIRLCGAAETPLSWGYTLDEILWCAQLAKFEYVITTSAREKELQAAGLHTINIKTILAQHNKDVEHGGRINVLPSVDANLAGRILFTSGTTGKPKGVIYTHGARWSGEQLLKATLPFAPQPGEKILLMTPFVHGASLLTYAWCDYGATVVLHQGVDTDLIAPLLEDNALKAIFAPPTVLAKITSAYEGQKIESIKCVFTGTQPLTAAVYQKARALFGPHIRITYGKSECVNPITVLDRQATEDYFEQSNVSTGACVGWPAPGIEIKIVRKDKLAEIGTQATAQDETHVADHDVTDGEVYLRSPHMSVGLIDQQGFRPHEPEGWHQTGDLGHFDLKGRLILTGRVADVIKTGGYRVNPDEIEAVLAQNELATQICVTSIPSDYWGEIIVAVAEKGATGWHEQSRALLSNMSRHKQPRHFVSVASLPRNPQGKVSRRQVSKLVLTLYRLVDGPYPELRQINPDPS